MRAKIKKWAADIIFLPVRFITDAALMPFVVDSSQRELLTQPGNSGNLWYELV
jgi:hypothetical protein